jgi:hypothetical protein
MIAQIRREGKAVDIVRENLVKRAGS